MIGSLRGTVLERIEQGTVLLEVGGVGYLVAVTPRTLAELEPSTTAFLHVHHHIREDAQTLYGFLHRDERTTFQVLIATHGIGPALALAVLGTHAPSALVDIIASNDINGLTLVPGVGKKTAERLLVELRNRLSLPMLDGMTNSSPGTPGASSVLADVREALTGLGYGHEEIRDALRELDTAKADASVLLRDALQLLGAKRA
ncbi:MAG: Holliday junction ATP-dependent helicase RuvA [Actinomycetota bacterium]|jgi:Holliday junction DNA helicase RuvA